MKSTENAACGETYDRRHPILQQMVRLCQESLKCDNGNAVEFAAAFADRYGEELTRLEIALLSEIEAKRCDTPRLLPDAPYGSLWPDTGTQ